MQLLSLELQWPGDGSLKSLCVTFLRAVDDALGTKYFKDYAIGYSTTRELLELVARVASLHYIEEIVLDGVENPIKGNSGKANVAINILARFEIIVGVSLILVRAPRGDAKLSARPWLSKPK